MAIYNNREVNIITPSRPVVFPEQVTIAYADGNHENVPLSAIRYTEDEKKTLIKTYPSVFDGVATISADDLKAVRVGVAPSYDPSYKVEAETQVRAQKQVEEHSKNLEKAKVEAKKSLDAKVKQ